jgi:hypothetical protein
MKYVNLTSWSYTSNYFYDETALANAIANIGPISVAVYVTNAFQSYSSGIFSDSNCNVIGTSGSITYPDLNHAVSKHLFLLFIFKKICKLLKVLAVGYGVDATTGKKYWLLKNQWGITLIRYFVKGKNYFFYL